MKFVYFSNGVPPFETRWWFAMSWALGSILIIAIESLVQGAWRTALLLSCIFTIPFVSVMSVRSAFHNEGYTRWAGIVAVVIANTAVFLGGNAPQFVFLLRDLPTGHTPFSLGELATLLTVLFAVFQSRCTYTP